MKLITQEEIMWMKVAVWLSFLLLAHATNATSGRTFSSFNKLKRIWGYLKFMNFKVYELLILTT